MTTSEPIAFHRHSRYPAGITAAEASQITAETGMDFFHSVDSTSELGVIPGPKDSVYDYLFYRAGVCFSNSLIRTLAQVGIVLTVTVDGQQRFVVRDQDPDEKERLSMYIDRAHQDDLTRKLLDDCRRWDEAAKNPVDSARFELEHGYPPVTVDMKVHAVSEWDVPVYRSVRDIRDALTKSLSSDPDFSRVTASMRRDEQDAAVADLLAALIRAQVIVRVECTTTAHLYLADLSDPAGPDSDIRTELQTDLITRIQDDLSGAEEWRQCAKEAPEL